MSNLLYFLALNHIPNIGPKTTQVILEHWPQLKDCFHAPVNTLRSIGLSLRVAEAIHHFSFDQLHDDLLFLKQKNSHVLTWEDPQYPSLLREIHDPPIVLYAIGDLACLDRPGLAIVGTRQPTHEGKKIAYEWSKALSLANMCIVSGLAQGIDTYAHLGCLDADQPTIAVMGAGLAHIYPSTNRDLASRITQKGLLLSEFSLFTPPKAGHFPRRNRIISGLTKATLVIEAALKSGSLITARLALEQNRDVFALPGSIHLPQSAGCHHLLKQGASLVTCFQDVLLELGFNHQPSSRLVFPVHHKNNKILNCIQGRATSLDTIIAQTGLTLDEVIEHITELELEGVIVPVFGGYALKHDPRHEDRIRS
jgi:DNA processing protein